MGSQRNITLPSNIGPFLLESLPSGGSAAEDREYLIVALVVPYCVFLAIFWAFLFTVLLLLIEQSG